MRSSGAAVARIPARKRGDRDDIFVGRVLGLRAIISFHGQTAQELRAAFEAAVDDFLQECEAAGIAPEKPASGRLLLRLSPQTHGAALVARETIPPCLPRPTP